LNIEEDHSINQRLNTNLEPEDKEIFEDVDDLDA
jgi:hypothetical protein